MIVKTDKNNMSKTLSKIIYDLPIFDDTETGQPCLEELAKEIGVNYTHNADQEDIAKAIIGRLTMYKKFYCLRDEVLDWWNNHKDDVAPLPYDDSYNIYARVPKMVILAQ